MEDIGVCAVEKTVVWRLMKGQEASEMVAEKAGGSGKGVEAVLEGSGGQESSRGGGEDAGEVCWEGEGRGGAGKVDREAAAAGGGNEHLLQHERRGRGGGDLAMMSGTGHPNLCLLPTIDLGSHVATRSIG